jgi:hypothetical protein
MPIHVRRPNGASTHAFPAIDCYVLPFQALEARASAAVAHGPALAISGVERQRDMAQRSVEILIGRLVTDEAFRSAFLADASAALASFVDAGHELTRLELSALCATPFAVWERAAEDIDARLQKIAFVHSEEE